MTFFHNLIGMEGWLFLKVAIFFSLCCHVLTITDLKYAIIVDAIKLHGNLST